MSTMTTSYPTGPNYDTIRGTWDAMRETVTFDGPQGTVTLPANWIQQQPQGYGNTMHFATYNTTNSTAAQWVGDFDHHVEPPKPPGPFERLAESFRKLKDKPPSKLDSLDLRPEVREAIESGAMPLIAGAAGESEVTRTVEHKKKIKLERTVGLDRPDIGKADAHRGTVELVRTMEGADHLTQNIGIKTEGSGGGSHVEIPTEEILTAVKELDPDGFEKFTGANGNGNGKS